jgi:hypothetical protein
VPLSRYDRYFGGNAAKALRAMIAKYGAQRGRQVFYATVNKKRRK